MYGLLLQDWITIRGVAPTTLTVVQSEKDWASLQAYQDLVFWLEVRELTAAAGGTGNIAFDFQTAPMKDETMFTNMISSVSINAASATPIMPSGIMPKAMLASATVPLARWVRWKVTANGTSGTWDVTFRLAVAANSVGLTGVIKS